MSKKNFIIHIKNIFSNNWKYRNSILFLAILLCVSLISYYHLSLGFSMSSDSERYSRWADDLIRLNFNFFEFFQIDRASHRPSLFFFSTPVFITSLCKVLFIKEWQFVFLIFNLILVFLSFLIVVKTLLLTEVRPILILLTLPIITLSVDILVWPRFILSDMIFAFLVTVATFIIIKIIIRNKINFFEIILIIFLLLASRPSSIPIVLAIIFFIAIYKLKIFSLKKNILLFLSGIVVLIPVILATIYLLIDFNFSYIPKIDFLTQMVKLGMIINDRPNTWVDAPSNFIDVMFIYFLRLINFFNPYASTFSILHIVINLFHILLIFLSISIWSFFRTQIKFQDRIFFFIIILSLSVATFHSFILIDYDWRYRFPIILPLLILFPISLENIIRKINFK